MHPIIDWAQNLDNFKSLSKVSTALFVILMGLVTAGYLLPMSRRLTNYIAWTGIILAVVLSLNCGLLYFWHNYYR
ncbi:MAG: hypothetical protein COV44_11065 [Deltaproteobacteria bacterium CG11_big_fil_rev_8_21_14_0_20_45_16]|nr:MAG: hypothetical protein COV44_11065 [Deltaproteobacteria bacterium CG11_big_fil_rev_8_21_14_0_20_45_16]